MLDISKLKYAVFDWDNTLVESRSSLTTAIDETLAFYKMPCWEKVKYLRDTNLSFKDNFPLIFGALAEEAYEHYREVYLKIMPMKIRVFPTVEKLLNFMSSRGILLYIVSNKERCLLEKEKELLLPLIHFRKIVCGHEASEDKPSPQQIYHALAGDIKPENMTPEQVWVIGDSPMDSQAAQRAHALPIRIGRSIWGDEGTQESGTVYFNDFNDFYQNLGTKF